MQRRAATECPAAYQLCAKSLGGGCCPSDRVCGTSSCFPSTAAPQSAAPQSACGLSGYIACGAEQGGGCCPSGYSCGENGCNLLPGMVNSQTCEVGSYLCPASLNYGCCRIGMGCGLTNCYSTAIRTFTMTETFTTTTNSQTRTYTSTYTTATTPQAPTLPTSTSTTTSIIPKVSASDAPIPKTAATSTPTTGLTAPEIGGIIGGAASLLFVILIAAFIILRRLNRAIKLSESAKSKGSSGYSRSKRHGRGSHLSSSTTLNIDLDTMSNDPFEMTRSEASRSARRNHRPENIYSPELENTEVSPPVFSSPFSPAILQPQGPQGYNAISGSESSHQNTPSNTTSPFRRISMASRGYFDITPHEDAVLRDQNLWFGRRSPRQPSQRGRNISDASDHTQVTRRPSQHTRNWSDVSDLSQQSNNSTEPAELEAGTNGDRRSSFQRALHGIGMGRLRRKSEPVFPAEGPPLLAQEPRDFHLEHIDEQIESLNLESENAPLTGLSNAQLRHLSVSGLQGRFQIEAMEEDDKP